MQIDEYLNPISWDALRERFRTAKPYPHFMIDNFLKAAFAEDVAHAFPSYAQAKEMGRSFAAVNEVGKVQITDARKFAPPIARLNEVLASPDFLERMSFVTGMPNLLADASLVGGGIHETGPRGRLDVHVDFNVLKGQEWHRRLNILIYFNEDWKPEYGGEVELWDEKVKTKHQSFLPIFNRCVVFETNEISFHGVSAVNCPPGMSRKSFAAYYYTAEAPAHFDGESHSTIFRARPDEKLKGAVLMPMERTRRWMQKSLHGLKQKVRRK